MRARREFTATESSVRAARVFVASTLAGWGCQGDCTALVVDELAANAVRHAQSGFSVEISWDGGPTVSVEVHDSSPRPPVRLSPDPGAPGGRGMVIVEALSLRWGTRHPPSGGKTVWAEVQESD